MLLFFDWKSMNERVKIKGDVYWAQLDKINEMSGKYQVDICNLSDAAVEALEAMGLSVNSNAEKKADMGRYITCKSERPIKAYDTDNDEVTENIGNGSKCKALIGTYPWVHKAKKGLSPSMSKLVITDLVEYAGGSLNADDEDVL